MSLEKKSRAIGNIVMNILPYENLFECRSKTFNSTIPLTLDQFLDVPKRGKLFKKLAYKLWFYNTLISSFVYNFSIRLNWSLSLKYRNHICLAVINRNNCLEDVFTDTLLEFENKPHRVWWGTGVDIIDNPPCCPDCTDNRYISNTLTAHLIKEPLIICGEQVSEKTVSIAFGCSFCKWFYVWSKTSDNFPLDKPFFLWGMSFPW